MSHRADGLNDIFENDVTIKKKIITDTGTISKNPVNDSDIVNKKYVDDVSINTGIDFYLYDDASTDIAGYKQLLPVISSGTKENLVKAVPANDTLIEEWITEADCDCAQKINTLTSGVYNLHIHTSAATDNRITLYFKLFKRGTLGAETLLFTSDETEFIGTTEEEINIHGSLKEDFPLITTDRVLIKVYANNNSPASTNITLYYEGNTASRITIKGLAAPRKHSALAGLAFDDAGHTGNLTISETGDTYLNLISTDHSDPYLLLQRGTSSDVYGDWKIGNVAGVLSLANRTTGAYTSRFQIQPDGEVDILTNVLDMNTHKITNVVDPTTDQEAATKKYVDDEDAAADAHISATGASHTYINQPVTTSSSPTFSGMTLLGATDATLTIRSGAGTYDTAIKFYDELTPKWYIGVDDSAANIFCIGTGSTVGSNRLMYMTSSSVYYTEGASFEGDCVINGGKFELTNGSRITINPTITFTDQDTTPDVGSGNSFITNNGRATTITRFDAAKGDQVFTIICNDANTTIQNNANIALAGSANFVMASGDTLTMLYSEALSKCIEIGRMIS